MQCKVRHRLTVKLTHWLVFMIMLIVISSLHGMKLRLNTRNSIISRNFICRHIIRHLTCPMLTSHKLYCICTAHTSKCAASDVKIQEITEYFNINNIKNCNTCHTIITVSGCSRDLVVSMLSCHSRDTGLIPGHGLPANLAV